ncbi:MAG: amino acid permease [Gammaproteobacteria bacterium]
MDSPLACSSNVQLSRTLKSRHVSMIAIGGIIGAGLFVGSSTAISQIGPAVVFSYAISGFIILLVMRMLSEMAIATPGVQSFPEFVRLGLGHLGGFMSGWLYWYFWVVVVAIEAIAGAKIMHEWLPQLPLWSIGVGLMAVLTAVNLMSTRSYGEFEFWFALVTPEQQVIRRVCDSWIDLQDDRFAARKIPSRTDFSCQF